MTFILRALRLLGIAIWFGGLIFFAFVEAPTAFRVMGTTRQFALLIGGSIDVLNQLGHASGLVFMVATIPLWLKQASPARRLYEAEVLLVFLMIAATMYVQMHIVPAMERDRIAAGGDIATVPIGSPARIDFDRLHGLSEKVEGSALFLGLGVILLMAAEPSGESRPSS